ncbi:MAG: hypothetical protein WC867_04315 [Candidatus Pacearchaeota archaeon]|jgi:hypothetical protein
MNQIFKKIESRKIFNVASFLFITIFFVLPYLVLITTYFHERGHVITLEKYGVRAYYSVDWILTIPNFYDPNVEKLGVTRFSIEDYNLLSSTQKADIHTAGIISDLRFLFLIGIYLTFINIFLFYKIRVREDVNLTLILAINWILFMWLIALILITLANVSSPIGDVHQLVNIVNRR